MKRYNARKPASPNPVTYIVQASDLSSMEVYRYPDGSEEQVLQGIGLNICRGESWGIIGDEAFEVELLLEIIGCVRPYGSGRCILVERGMMRKKRRILPHVFFISDGDAVFPNMSTLEYLMFVTAHSNIPAVERQVSILEFLLDTGLYYLTLVPVKLLSRAQKAVVCLLAAFFSNALLVIFSVSQLDFDERLTQGIKGIAAAIAKKGCALLIGARDSDMVQAACTHAGFLVNGRIIHSGSMEDMLANLDRRVFTLGSAEPDRLANALQNICPELSMQIHNQKVHIYDYRANPITQPQLLQILLQVEETVEFLQTSKKTLENAYREVRAGHDL